MQVAITDNIGIIDFYHYDDKSGAHSTLPNVPLEYEKRKLAVISTTLDAYLREKAFRRLTRLRWT